MENEIKQNYENFLLKEKFNDSQINNKKDNLDNFFKRGFPNRRLEDWKFSDFNQVVNANIENLNYIAEIDNNIVFDQRPIEDFYNNKSLI
jgi:Fe-S cluster assembly protein SufD